MRILFLIITAFLWTGNLYSQWYQQNSGNVNTLKSVFFINHNTGWICGFECVLKTTDCGNNWSVYALEGFHKSVFFTDENTGWICGDNGKIFKTVNGGVNWLPVSSGVTSALNQITFFNNNTGLISGSNKKILKSTDSGNTWNNINNFNTELDFHSVKILNNGHYIVTGTESSVYVSTNSGSIWDTLSLGMPNPLLTSEFIDQNTGWISGCCGMFMKTTDGGANWSPEVYLTPGYSINSMKFINVNSGWAAGDAGYILRTSNSGLSWDSLNSTTQAGIYSLFFLNKDTGFAAGYNGLILRTTNGGGEGFPLNVLQISNETPGLFTLEQNYPNPFNPSTYLEFSISKREFVNLKVYDLLGSEVTTLINEFKNAGRYTLKFDGSNLASGIYFYSITAGNLSDKKMMILLK